MPLCLLCIQSQSFSHLAFSGLLTDPQHTSCKPLRTAGARRGKSAANCRPREHFLSLFRYCFPAILVSLAQINSQKFSTGSDVSSHQNSRETHPDPPADPTWCWGPAGPTAPTRCPFQWANLGGFPGDSGPAVVKAGGPKFI